MIKKRVGVTALLEPVQVGGWMLVNTDRLPWGGKRRKTTFMAGPDFLVLLSPLYLQFARSVPWGGFIFFFAELSFLREMEIGQFDVNYVGLFRGRKKVFLGDLLFWFCNSAYRSDVQY